MRTPGEEEKEVTRNRRTGRLVRFLFCPPRLGPVPPAWVGSAVLCGPPALDGPGATGVGRVRSPLRTAVGESGAHGVPALPETGRPLLNRFAARLAKSPPDLVTRLGMARSSAYYEAGCPLELCDHAAARDLWRVIYEEAMGKERYGTGV